MGPGPPAGGGGPRSKHIPNAHLTHQQIVPLLAGHLRRPPAARVRQCGDQRQPAGAVEAVDFQVALLGGSAGGRREGQQQRGVVRAGVAHQAGAPVVGEFGLHGAVAGGAHAHEGAEAGCGVAHVVEHLRLAVAVQVFHGDALHGHAGHLVHLAVVVLPGHFAGSGAVEADGVDVRLDRLAGHADEGPAGLVAPKRPGAVVAAVAAADRVDERTDRLAGARVEAPAAVMAHVPKDRLARHALIQADVAAVVVALGVLAGHDDGALPHELRLSLRRELDEAALLAVLLEHGDFQARSVREHVSHCRAHLHVRGLEHVHPVCLAGLRFDHGEARADAEEKVLLAVAAQVAGEEEGSPLAAAPARGPPGRPNTGGVPVLLPPCSGGWGGQIHPTQAAVVDKEGPLAGVGRHGARPTQLAAHGNGGPLAWRALHAEKERREAGELLVVQRARPGGVPHLGRPHAGQQRMGEAGGVAGVCGARRERRQRGEKTRGLAECTRGEFWCWHSGSHFHTKAPQSVRRGECRRLLRVSTGRIGPRAREHLITDSVGSETVGRRGRVTGDE